jgi:triacylglycerol esterase/lipase EstA (alpha/beta hydrolase family)
LAERAFPGPQLLADRLTNAAAGAPASAGAVVLVPGMGNSPATFSEFARSLTADGFQVTIANIPNHAMGNILDSAAALSPVVDAAVAASGLAKVHLLGYSEGGLIAREYLRNFGGAAKVDALVTLATPNHGSRLALHEGLYSGHPHVANVLPEAMRDMAADGPIIEDLNADADAVPAGVRYVSIRNPAFDGFVSPASSPDAPGAENVVLAPDHTLLGRSVSPNHYSIVHTSAAAYAAARAGLIGPAGAATAAARAVEAARIGVTPPAR